MNTFAEEVAALREWLFDVALPLWWIVGADHTGGGFHEAIGLDGRPAASAHRARTIARQAFSYCAAGRLGWRGPWREAATHALDYFREHFIAADSTVVSLIALDGNVADAGFDLYDQAFGLLAYASGHRAFGPAAGWRTYAGALREALEGEFADGRGGYLESRDGALPRRANPHMHLLESALAWAALDPDPAWRRMADGIALLCLKSFIEPGSGALREYFAADWLPAAGAAGRLCEPGHHYEWAFLLTLWARLTGRPSPPEVRRLIAFADTHGLDHERGVAINAVLTDGTPHDTVARLWAQAERIRAYCADPHPGHEKPLTAAIRGLRRFLTISPPGAWFDQLAPNDRFVEEPARATSLYHIIGAVEELAKL